PSTTEILPLSLHDALPICSVKRRPKNSTPSRRSDTSQPSSPNPCRTQSVWCPALRSDHIVSGGRGRRRGAGGAVQRESSVATCRSEEHTSELQSPCNLVCR